MIEEHHREQAGEPELQQQRGKAHQQHASKMGAAIGLGRELGRGLDYNHGFGQMNSPGESEVSSQESVNAGCR